MTNLLLQNQEFNSIKVADITGKRHDNVIRDIEDEIDKIGHNNAALIFEFCTYKGGNGRELPMYKMNKKGWLQIGARYDAKTRFTLIAYAEKLEEENRNIKQQYEIPQTLSQALMLAE